MNPNRPIPPFLPGEIDMIVSGARPAAKKPRPNGAPIPIRPQDTEPEPRFPEPEDRGTATLSELGEIEYVDDLVRPGRVVGVAAEEGTGKSFAMAELGIRVATVGGSFAGTWPVLRTGPVLYLSEMHADDDHARESTILASLGVERATLTGAYYRLGLMTAAGGRPVLTDPAWRSWVTDWLKRHGALLLIFDTATAATRVEPWGPEILNVYADLRMMLDDYPELAIVLVVHLKKPTGHGDRKLSDVLGEWGRWNDVTLLMENDGSSLERVKITVRKRVRNERRIVATKAGGLLVEPVEIATSGPRAKAPPDKVREAVEAKPGSTYAELGAVLGVSGDTAARYVKSLGMTIVKGVKGSPARVYPTGQTTMSADSGPELSPYSASSAGEATEKPGMEGAANAPYSAPHYISAEYGAEHPIPAAEDLPPICGCGNRKIWVAEKATYVCTNGPGHVRATESFDPERAGDDDADGAA